MAGAEPEIDEFAAALAEAEAGDLDLVEPEAEAEVPEEEIPVEQEDDMFDGEDGVEVEEHLKDAVEGSLRLKRLLSRDDDSSPGAKKMKMDVNPEKAARIQKLVTKWMLPHDQVVKHVLEQASEAELDEVLASTYMPDRSNVWKSTGELLGTYMSDLRQRKAPGGYGTDQIAAAKFRWKLDLAQEQQLRKLSHKDLRCVLDNYDGSGGLVDVISQATSTPHDEDSLATTNALPGYEGLSTMGRFHRLELIDPLADSAVFGDANLTFSMRLARHRKALGHVGRVIATTFEDLPTLRERYKEIDDNIKILEEEHSAEVFHCVDCTRIALDEQFKGMEGTLGAVYYNFPHSGAIQGFFDGHPVVNWRHENLMRLFFRALRTFVKEGGVVKVASNAGAVGVKYYFIINSALDSEFEHTETVPFLQWHLHRYGRSYGDKRDVYKRPDAKKNESYNAQAADRDMVYCFRYRPTGKTLDRADVRLPPTLKTLMAVTDGPFKNLQPAGKKTMAENLHKRFVTEVSGTHVG